VIISGWLGKEDEGKEILLFSLIC